MSTPDWLLETAGLTKVYPGAEPVVAIDQINLGLRQGEFVSIIGPSGSGKSTLMNVLGLLDRPTGGQLRYLGEDAAHWGIRQQSDFRNRFIGFIFQAHLLLPEFTALENVLMPLRIGRTLNARSQAYARSLLERIGMGDRLNFRPPNLSGGQNQRVAIARALVNRPKIVFADEPTGALDTRTGQQVFNLMREISAEEQVTFVLVTHDPTLAARTDRIIRIQDGHIQSDGAPEPMDG